MSYFLDSGFLIALESLDDQHHQEAISFWQELIKSPLQLITTTFVFDEVVTFFNTRGRHDKAVEIGNRLRESPSVDMIQVDQQLLDKAWKFFTIHSDKKFSLTDCVSFVVMANRKITSALTFDKHFEQAGCSKSP